MTRFNRTKKQVEENIKSMVDFAIDQENTEKIATNLVYAVAMIKLLKLSEGDAISLFLGAWRNPDVK